MDHRSEIARPSSRPPPQDDYAAARDREFHLLGRPSWTSNAAPLPPPRGISPPRMPLPPQAIRHEEEHWPRYARSDPAVPYYHPHHGHWEQQQQHLPYHEPYYQQQQQQLQRHPNREPERSYGHFPWGYGDGNARLRLDGISHYHLDRHFPDRPPGMLHHAPMSSAAASATTVHPSTATPTDSAMCDHDEDAWSTGATPLAQPPRAAVAAPLAKRSTSRQLERDRPASARSLVPGVAFASPATAAGAAVPRATLPSTEQDQDSDGSDTGQLTRPSRSYSVFCRESYATMITALHHLSRVRAGERPGADHAARASSILAADAVRKLCREIAPDLSSRKRFKRLLGNLSITGAADDEGEMLTWRTSTLLILPREDWNATIDREHCSASANDEHVPIRALLALVLWHFPSIS
ncbi:hypothetical protein BC828DRAFT_137097 [Blastocladiella britannica]|nr:hypothetical protein BC828DRAFT_137097 [Blastocladiella britannica]